MHLLATSTVLAEDTLEAVDIRQAPADMLALSFTDSDLSSIGRAARARGASLPSLRLVNLRDLRHPMSVDLWIDTVARHAKIILVRALGGFDWWSYGCERLGALAREQGIALALLPGEGQAIDEKLAAASTLPPAELELLLAYFRAGGSTNMENLLARLALHAGCSSLCEPPAELPNVGCYEPDAGVVSIERMMSARREKNPLALILFYRSMLLASDTAPIDALCEALLERGVFPAPVFLPSLKDSQAVSFIESLARDNSPALIVTTTAFSSGAELFAQLGAPVLQAIVATTRREAWQASPRGLAPADMAMHVALPEIDGRILAGALSFKTQTTFDDALEYRGQINGAESDRIAQVAERARLLIALREKPAAEKRILILLPDYPAAPGRAGYAVGLDAPASVIAALQDLREAGYQVEAIPAAPRALLDGLASSHAFLTLFDYCAFLESLPTEVRKQVDDAWGDPAGDEACIDDRFHFRAKSFGYVTVAMAPDRGRRAHRRADYHDPLAPPRHALLAFGAWMRRNFDAMIHMGAHGAIEWLPGKAAALGNACFPELVIGALPVIYPFIVNNPGEAAQAKRRIGAITLGHLPPPLIEAGLSENQQKLERLADEFVQADGLDRRRRDRLAQLIVATANELDIAGAAGVKADDDSDATLKRIDAFLCDLKEFAIKDGLHVFGRIVADEADPARAQSACNERMALLRALDGAFITPGPAGAPARGRRDVMPTGRNLYACDPRAIPTPTAYDLGSAAASETLRRYCQDHGDWPRSLVIDLWGSASLRTGGEEIAQGLALMGCQPRWDANTGRVTGVEILPPATMSRPRVDVTWRISGLFRDMFASQISLIDAAVQAIAKRDDAEGDNPLADSVRGEGAPPCRIFGAAPGVYGAGVEDMLADGGWQNREEIGEAWLAGASYAYGGADAAATLAPDALRARIAHADLLVHIADDSARDILEGGDDLAYAGGFAAALAALGTSADIVVLDTSNPHRPRARTLAETIERVVRARAINPKFIAGQMRHGPRGASEFLETVDRLIGFAETTQLVPGALIECVYNAYIVDDSVRHFLLEENPAAARAMAERFASARTRGLWRPMRNSIDDDLADLIADAHARMVTT